MLSSYLRGGGLLQGRGRGIGYKALSMAAIHTTHPVALTRLTRLEPFKAAVSAANIQFLPSPHQDSVSKGVDNPTLVILCGWLGASERNLSKYVTLWHRRNVDVLKISTRWIDVLTPTYTVGVNAPKVTEGLLEVRQLYPNVLFHTLSAGVYFYASMMMQAEASDRSTQAILKKLIKGAILDSPVDWPAILQNKRAMAEILHPRVLQVLPVGAIKQVISDRRTCPLLLRYSPGSIDFFVQRNKVLKANWMHVPTLILLSRIDPLCDIKTVYNMALDWHRRGIPVASQCWKDAPHVELYRRYPQEYGDLVDSFVSRVKE